MKSLAAQDEASCEGVARPRKGFTRIAVIETNQEDSESDGEWEDVMTKDVKTEAEQEGSRGAGLPDLTGGKKPLSGKVASAPRQSQPEVDVLSPESSGSCGPGVANLDVGHSGRHDPSGSVGSWLTCTDEQGRTQRISQDAFDKGTHAKLRSVRRQGGQEERDLSELEEQTRKMDAEVLKAKTNAGHAASEIYSPTRIVKLLKEWG